MSRPLTRAQLATALGVDQRTVTRWVDMGCPHSRVKGRLMFNEEETRAWCEQYGLRLSAGAQAAEEPGAAAPRGPLAMANLVRKVTQAKRSELELAAERALKDLGLDEKIRKAGSFDDYTAIDLEVGALLANGTLSPDRARAIQSVIADARQNTKAHREAEHGDEDQDRLLIVTQEGHDLLDLYEGIVSDERRARIMEHVRGEAALDLAENPNTDTALEPEGEGAGAPPRPTATPDGGA